MELDEFTFPTTNPNNSPIDSPPLWRLSPTASPTPSYKQQGTSYDQLKLPGKLDHGSHVNLYTRRSCSFLEGRCLTKRSKMVRGNNTTTTLDDDDDDDQDQEKMDMLWEDLNYDELFKNNSKRDSKMIEFHGKYSKGGNEMEQFGCVSTPFKLVRTSAMKGANNKKPSLLVFVKVLKRLFVLQQSSKKRSR